MPRTGLRSDLYASRPCRKRIQRTPQLNRETGTPRRQQIRAKVDGARAVRAARQLDRPRQRGYGSRPVKSSNRPANAVPRVAVEAPAVDEIQWGDRICRRQRLVERHGMPVRVHRAAATRHAECRQRRCRLSPSHGNERPSVFHRLKRTAIKRERATSPQVTRAIADREPLCR